MDVYNKEIKIIRGELTIIKNIVSSIRSSTTGKIDTVIERLTALDQLIKDNHTAILEKFETVNTNFNDIKNLINNVGTKIDTVNVNVLDVNTNVKANADKLDDLNSTSTDIFEATETISTNLSTVNSTVNSVKEKVDTIDTNISTVITNTETIDTNVSNNSDKLDEINTLLETLDIADTNSLLNTVNDKVATLQTSIDSMSTDVKEILETVKPNTDE